MASNPNLPDGKSPTLALVHPTEEEKLHQFKLNGVQWRGALSEEAYLRREEVLSSQALTRDGGITYWILIDTAMKENPLDPTSSIRLPLASCETYRKKALVWQNGKVTESICHGIGSVFCNKQLRRRGYAQRMLQQLGKALETHQATEKMPCLFSVLFSDIGKEFYTQFGWEPFNSSHISVPARTNTPVDDLPTARPLFAEDLEELCQIDEALVRKTLEIRPADSKTAVALIPDIETIRWFHAREEFVANELHNKKPKVKGAIVGSEKGKRIWALWTRMFYNENPKESKNNILHILRIVIEDEGSSSWEGVGTDHVNGSAGNGKHDAAIAALLQVAQQEAQEWNMEEVEAWNPTSATVSATQKLDPNAIVVNRDMESIASLKWFPNHEGSVAESIDWIGNEKYGWC
ncbi:hypothetical protein GQ43DRAFT_437555 [Delitschia confertaspora ATCC 74209]|uniref:LYC1 C-terminal domain-containing protein n=1 Tax=Delitschia confertaspora ATCC 74209 TaxID=1513339 RepID=A0A9P4MW79_9PLEO|nr:hypothetical protein GQ43DRAFT_437555 [Delitschia confertaspora ATCC 74209]